MNELMSIVLCSLFCAHILFLLSVRMGGRVDKVYGQIFLTTIFPRSLGKFSQLRFLLHKMDKTSWTYGISGCGPCKMIAPHLEEMDKTMADVVFLKVDVDECEDLAQEYKVQEYRSTRLMENKFLSFYLLIYFM